MEDNKKNLLWNIVLTAIYGLITLVVVLHHEIWADEAQVWMIVKNVSLTGLFQHLVNEGHPSFFYLLLMPLAKGGASILSMQLICWLAAVLSIFLLLQFSPFDRFTKFAITTSAGFLYFFPVIARSYSILPFLVFLTAILYPKAKERPFLYMILLVLMANTHIIMFVFAGLLAMFFIYDNIIKDFKGFKELDKLKKKQLLTAAVIAVFGLLAVWLQLSGTTSSNVFIKFDFTQIVKNTLDVMTKFFLNPIANQTETLITIRCPLIEIPAILLSIILYIMFFATLLVNNKRLFALASLSILFQVAIYVLGYHFWVFTTRIFCAHIILLFCFWVMLADKNPESGFKPKFKFFNRKFINITLSVFFILTMLNGVRYSVLDLKYSYSGAKETAEFIKNNIDKDNSIIITDNEPYSVTIAYYLDGSGYGVYSAMHRKNITYITWDKLLYNILSSNGWDLYAKYMREEDKNFRTKKIYAIFPMFNKYSLHVDNLQNYKMIFESKPSILKYEGFRIYEYQG